MAKLAHFLLAAALFVFFGPAVSSSQENGDRSITLPSDKTIQMWIKRHNALKSKPKDFSPADEKEKEINTKKPDSLSIVVPQGYGGICYIGPCDRPLDGTRWVCYYDFDGWCEDCGWEWDPVCEPY